MLDSFSVFFSSFNSSNNSKLSVVMFDFVSSRLVNLIGKIWPDRPGLLGSVGWIWFERFDLCQEPTASCRCWLFSVLILITLTCRQSYIIQVLNKRLTQ